MGYIGMTKAQYHRLWRKRHPDADAKYRATHKEKIKLAHKKWRETHIESIKAKAFVYRPREREIKPRRLYGLTLDGYGELLARQAGRCAICRRPKGDFKKNLAVDHDHKTGAIRGLLCPRCNACLVLLDDKVWLANATDYLNRNSL